MTFFSGTHYIVCEITIMACVIFYLFLDKVVVEIIFATYIVILSLDEDILRCYDSPQKFAFSEISNINLTKSDKC